MESRIGHLHYRVRTVRGARVPPGLEQMARERLGEALGAALGAALGDDPGVYVLRSIRADVAVDLAAREPDRLIAERWADRLTVAITQALADEDDEGVARFADEAEFIARFVADLVDGAAWERWYYGAFAGLRPLGRRGALRAVLIENSDQLGAILAWLARHGALERVLAALDDATLAALQPRREPELVRPLLAAALRVADAVGAVRGTGPSLNRVLEQYFRAPGYVPSWRDRRALADGVLDALRFLARAGVVELGAQPDAAAQDRLGSLRRELDWLDVERLDDGLVELAGAAALPPAGHREPPARASRRHALLAELGAALGWAGVTLDVRDPASGANALRLQAVLAANSGGVTADGGSAAIAGLLDAVARLMPHPVAGEVWALIAAGDESGAWRLYGAAGAAAADIDALASAPEVVRCFAPADAGVAESHAGRWIESPCAGALLLLRAAFDVRLPALAPAGAPDVPELLLAITLRAGGPEALGQRADAGLAAALGFAEPPTAARLVDGWSATSRSAHRDFRAAIGAAVEARGLSLAGDDPPSGGELGDEAVDRTVGLATAAVLRAWAQWLRGFSGSSLPFVLERFVRRPGRVALSDGRATVELERLPLDLVLELAGHLDPLEPRPDLPLGIDFVLTRQ